jgi:hypothetical protein
LAETYQLAASARARLIRDNCAAIVEAPDELFQGLHGRARVLDRPAPFRDPGPLRRLLDGSHTGLIGHPPRAESWRWRSESVVVAGAHNSMFKQAFAFAIKSRNHG